jgi:DNA-binding winged helix-turn-helix (wHTH) protein
VLTGTIIQFADFELDQASRELRRNGVPIHLQRQAFEILIMLASRPGTLVSRLDIRDKLWPDEPFGDIDRRLNFQIRNIRSALGDDPENPVYIATVPKSGYKFIAPIEVQNNLREPKDYVTTHRDRSLQSFIRSRRSAIFLILGILAIVAAGLIAAGTWRKKDKSSELFSRPVSSERVDGTPTIVSVSPIFPVAIQRIEIKGSGFGVHSSFQRLDTPYLAVRDKTSNWAAGRIIPANADEVTLSVSEWTDSKVTITGFFGAYGKNNWILRPNDEIEIVVWNPQTGGGPATFRLRVSTPR